MEELFPQSVLSLFSENELSGLLREQCLRDLERAGFRMELSPGDLPPALVVKLSELFRGFSPQQIARISYIADIPDSILRASERDDIPVGVFAEAFVRRAALKVVTRLAYSRKQAL